jgi:hypothetical protein
MRGMTGMHEPGAIGVELGSRVERALWAVF